MAETVAIKQAYPAANVLTTLWTAVSRGVCSSIVCCNQGPTTAKIRISVAIAGAADASAQYLEYDRPIPGNRSYVMTIGQVLAATDVMRVYSDTGQVSFNASTDEVT